MTETTILILDIVTSVLIIAIMLRRSLPRKIKLKYTIEGVSSVAKIREGDWIDLYAADSVRIQAGDFKLIPLGVTMKLPTGYEAHVVPRSSTYMKYHVIQANSMGVIDNAYCGDLDEWKFPAYATDDTFIPAGDRICQFRIVRKQPSIKFDVVSTLGGKNRGGFGSTGRR